MSRTASENHAALSRRTGVIEQSVASNKETTDTALASQHTLHTQALSALTENFTQQLGSMKQKLEQELADLRGETEKEAQAAKSRLDLLERPVWRKCWDWMKARVQGLRAFVQRKKIRKRTKGK
jgi:hypothetical protein